jgi:glutamate dehydrogenase
MTQHEGHTSVLLDNVSKLILSKVKAANVSLIEQFAKTLYSNMLKEDLASRNDSDLYGAALSLWNSLESQQNDEPFIRVFNPELSKHGWQSSHTVVELIVKDMPFLVDSVRMALSRENIAAHLLLHCPLKVNRDAKTNQITALAGLKSEQQSDSTKTVFFY